MSHYDRFDLDDDAIQGLYDLDDTDSPLRGLGEVPPGTSGADRASVRKSYYYLYTVATLAPKLRAIGVVTTGASIAAVVVDMINVLGNLSTLGLAGMGVMNSAEETTLWWKRTKKDRDNYIRGALIQSDTRLLLQKAARRMDSVATARTPRGRNMQRARAYFQDFIAVGPQAALKNLNLEQQAAFGAAYLDALGARKKEADAMAAGSRAAGKATEAQAKAAKAAQMKQIRERIAEARRQNQAKLATAKAQAVAVAKRKLAVVEKQRALMTSLPPALRPAGISNQAQPLNPNQISQLPPQLQQEVAAIQAEVALVQAEEVKAATDVQTAEVAVVEAIKDEVKIDAEVKVADAAVEAVAPTEAEKSAAAAADSAEDKEADKVAEKVADKIAPASTGLETGASTGGLPIVPILVVAGLAAFLLMRKK